MKNYYWISLITLVSVFSFSFIGNSESVYICDSIYASRYHLSSECKGLDKCTHEIVKLSKKEAEEKGRTICKLEK